VSARGKARKEALDQLFQVDLRGVTLTSDAFETSRDYAKEILLGVIGNFARIDELIKSYIQGWDFDRLPTVDRNILRIAIWELLWTQTPESVVIDEALKLASGLSTENSPTFIHGVLSKISVLKGQIAL
jgi:N utilization substance protein B